MKPYRVKRAGKPIGSFLVVHRGKRVNLQTKDASEARRRAILVGRGQWPPEVDKGAARAVNAALEGAPEGPPVVDSPPVPPPLESNPSATGSDANTAAGAPPPAPAAVEAPPVEAATAVNEAAAEPIDPEVLEAEAKDALAKAGIDLSEIQAKAPEYLGKLHMLAQGHLLRVPVWLVKDKWPPYPKLPENDGGLVELRGLIGKLWAAKLAKLNLDLSKIGPGWWLLLLAGVTAVAQAGVMLESMQPEKGDEFGPKD